VLGSRSAVTGLFATGRIVDLILVLTLLEGIILVAYYRLTGRGLAPADLLSNLVAGICLLLALRDALLNASWVWIALWLSAALLAHLADLQRRWRR
jgi:hypothetical protein